MKHIAPTHRRALNLLSAAFALTFTFTGQTHAGSILREVFEGIGGVTVADLTNSPAYPNSPTSTSSLTVAFEAPIDVLDSYGGQRVRGYVIAPATGNAPSGFPATMPRRLSEHGRKSSERAPGCLRLLVDRLAGMDRRKPTAVCAGRARGQPKVLLRVDEGRRRRR